MFSSVFVIHRKSFAIAIFSFSRLTIVNFIMPHKNKNRNSFVSELKRMHEFELYSYTSTPHTRWHFVLRCALRNARGSNLRRLAGERALRLGFARLSAPPPLCGDDAVVANLSFSAKRKIRNTRMGIPYFWRRRRDLNSRAGITDLHP